MTGNGNVAARPGFTVAVHNNKYRWHDDRELSAVITVTAANLSSSPEFAEVILLDTSGSMNDPQDKIVSARRATAAAIDVLDDGVRFAVVAGTTSARMVYPTSEGLAVASADTRQAAKKAIQRWPANGGTAIGRWLDKAGTLLAGQSSAVRHALLFTDGKNEHETREQLDEVLNRWYGRYACDARGIGTDWQPSEVLHIASVLGGRADAVRAYADMPDDFREIMAAAMRKKVADVTLRLTTMPGATLRDIKQMYPTMDLSGQRIDVDERTTDLRTASWAEEHREYLVSLKVDPKGRPIGEDTIAARVQLLISGNDGPGPAARILLHWTDDPKLSSQIDPKVAHHTGQEQLAQAVRLGCDAHKRGDTTTAERELGRAVTLAAATNNAEMLTRLGRLVYIVDETRGVVRLKTENELIDVFSAEMAPSTATSSLNEPADDGGVESPGSLLECPSCQHLNEATALLCESCKMSLDGLR